MPVFAGGGVVGVGVVVGGVGVHVVGAVGVGVGVGGCGRSPCRHKAKHGMPSASVASQR